MPIKIIKDTISKSELSEIARNQFGDFVKAVVDIKKKIMAIGGELHADEETLLLEHGSRQENLWGINLYPNQTGDDWIEFDSMINVRPSQQNYSRRVQDLDIQKRLIHIVNTLVS